MLPQFKIRDLKDLFRCFVRIQGEYFFFKIPTCR